MKTVVIALIVVAIYVAMRVLIFIGTDGGSVQDLTIVDLYPSIALAIALFTGLTGRFRSYVPGLWVGFGMCMLIWGLPLLWHAYKFARVAAFV